MLNPRCRLILEGPPLALQTFKASLDTTMAGMTVTRRHRDWARAPLNGEDERIFDVELSDPAHLDTLRTFMAGRVAALRAAGVRGTVSVHQCPHDEPVVFNCRDDTRAQFQEVRI